MITQLPASWMDPIALGDLKAGVETLEHKGVHGETGLALVWLAAGPVCQQRTGFVVDLINTERDGVPTGDWRVAVVVQGKVRQPDPAQAMVLREDGQRVWDVAHALTDSDHPDPLHKAHHTALSLLVGRAWEHKENAWVWATPLGRIVSVIVQPLQPET
jgi:hypothetical protein